jgi:N-acetylmuramic acid 6-phosphate etherase
MPCSTRLPPTEQRNPRSRNLDRLPISKAVRLMLSEEAKVPRILAQWESELTTAVKLVARSFRRGGRLFYGGAGTSGRLGVLDASECPPTFRVTPEMVQGIIAGGETALRKSVEGAEDDPAAGARAIRERKISPHDVVMGIAASGTTPFVWGALAESKRRYAKTILLCFNPHLKIPRPLRPQLVIAPDLGPEVLTGSTRLKAGTATKLMLNTLTTLAMVQLGKVASNLMVDVTPTNVKLRARAVRILQELAGVDEPTARRTLEQSGWVIKTAATRLARKSGARPAQNARPNTHG